MSTLTMDLRYGFYCVKMYLSKIFHVLQDSEKLEYMQVEENDQIEVESFNRREYPSAMTTSLCSRLVQYALVASLSLNIFVPIILHRLVKVETEGPFPPTTTSTHTEKDNKKGQFEKITFHDIITSEAFSKNLLPKGAGWTIVDEPHQYNLPPGIQLNGSYNKYSVSWAHQFHCLRMLRDEFWAHVENQSSIVGVKLGGDPTDPDVIKLTHLDHCHGYLLQAILCNMDMTIGYPTGNGIAHGTIDGAGITHTCTKREVFDKYMTMHWPIEDGYVENAPRDNAGAHAYGHGH